MNRERAFLAGLCGLVATHRPHLSDAEILALVMAWCMAQGETMAEEVVDAVGERAEEIADALAPVPPGRMQ